LNGARVLANQVMTQAAMHPLPTPCPERIASLVLTTRPQILAQPPAACWMPSMTWRGDGAHEVSE
jgi:hypothetical protein